MVNFDKLELNTRYFRGNGKWAKVTGKRGAWWVALGWEGEITATKSNTTKTKDHAEIIARNWLAY